jgi:outer membrane protein OmpA-like peptidoglycan-associated protein
MISTKLSVAAMLAGVLALSACTEPGGSILAQPGTPNQKTRNGALIGAATGALAGALIKDDNRGDGALVGAVVGGALGAGIGYNLDKQEAELRNQLGGEIGIVNTGDRLIVSLPNNLLFATDSTVVSPTLQGDLRALAQNVQVYANSTLQIVGHTDSDGDAAYNQTLSEGRARSVANILIGNGVPGGRIQTFGRGESQPIASNLTPEGKAQNRRVEIVILPNAS